MNHTILMDKIWKVYSLFPHCLITTYVNKNKARRSFNYTVNSNISIVSVNCIGGEIYSILGIPFNSPFINTSMNRKHFIIMCEQLKHYLSSELKVCLQNDGYYVGMLSPKGLPTVRIRFDHDNDSNEILEKWTRRLERINWDKIVLICDDKDLDDDYYERFDNIKAYKKIMLTVADKSEKYSWCHQLKAYGNRKHTGTYNGKSVLGGWKFQYMWDFVTFLNNN